jgi:hypothetical protein
VLAPLRLAAVVVAAGFAAGCATPTTPTPEVVVTPRAGEYTVLKARALDRALEDRVLALDATRVSARDVADVLSKVPAPRIMLVHGGVFPVHLAMVSFGSFLVELGYPEARIRDPGNGEWSYSPYTTTPRLAGIVAWHYEQDGLRPMIIGHSQGGLYVVKVLKELAGTYQAQIPVWNPMTDLEERRDTIIDPLTGRERPVVGVSMSYASALGAGGWALLLPHQWDDFANLRRIPDTVQDFTGYFIALDLFALSFPGNPFDVPYQPNGAAKVRNMILPAATSHVFVPVTHQVLADPEVRTWLDTYVPDLPDAKGAPGAYSGSLLWAADVWYSIKKHWTLEAQRMIRARRAASGGG